MKTLLLKKFNNYFNRIIVKYSTLDEYKEKSSSFLAYSNVNFNPNDGVTTELVVGNEAQQSENKPLDWEDSGNPDYLVCYETVEGVDTIKSRWFITDSVRTRNGQYKLTLKRDVISDNYDVTINAPTYIEKGYISDVNNPLLYNKESLAVNQIKQYEVPLKDETKSGWVVGYIARDAFDTDTVVTGSVILSQTPDITVNGLSSWSYWKNCTNNSAYKKRVDTTNTKKVNFKIKSEYHYDGNYYFSTKRIYLAIDGSIPSVTQSTSGSGSFRSGSGSYPSWYTDWTNLKWDGGLTTNGSFSNSIAVQACSGLAESSTFKNYLSSFVLAYESIEIGNTDTLKALENKILLDSSTGIYYKIRINTDSTSQTITASGGTEDTNFINSFNSNITRTGLSSTGSLTGNIGVDEISASIEGKRYFITLEQAPVSITTTITKSSDRLHLEDAPYDMFCIPYSDDLQLKDGNSTFTCNKLVALNMATAIGAKAGASSQGQVVYDIQLLPYCPMRLAIQNSDQPAEILDITNISHNLITTAGESPVNKSAVIWCDKSTFSLEINSLDGIENCSFKTPYTDLEEGIIRTEKYYIIPTLPQRMPSSIERAAVGTTQYNKIHVYKVQAETGVVVEDMGYFNNIEFVQSSSSDVALHIYKYGNYQNPEINYTYSQYNNLSVRFVFFVENTGHGAQNQSVFCSIVKWPSMEYYDINLSTPEDVKITNDCNLYRLSSGNYSSMFEFSPAKSQGFDGYKIDCTYKPFSPWIHVIPKLKGLYGENFSDIDDARGLICGGDYSISQMSDAWANFELNNKTYQEMFDRQIQNMDVTNSIAMQQAKWQAGAGALTGMASGAATGAIAGSGAGPLGIAAGAIIGGVTGGIASGIGGAMDVENLRKLQAENKDYAIDTYNYSLQNIQAIPMSLTRSSALTYNTRIWPFLEVYTCTDTEKELYRNKLKYDGMTVMAIGSLGDYIVPGEEHYFKGEIIRLPALHDDNHMAAEIYVEIKKGVYL